MAGVPWLIARTARPAWSLPVSWQWVMCGVSASPPDRKPCAGLDVVSFADYWKLRHQISDGAVKPGQTVMFDQENWTLTPRLERQHPVRYLLAAIALAKAHRVTLIDAAVPIGPYDTPAQRRAAGIAWAVLAVRAGVPVMDIQDQSYTGTTRTYAEYAAAFVRAVRKASKRVLIMDNLGTDSGGFPVNGVPAATIYASFKAARKAGVQAFWLETPLWPSACDDTGCPAIAEAFIADLQGAS